MPLVVLQDALKISRDVGNTWIVAAVLLDLAQVALERRDVQRAAALFEECLATAEQITDSRRLAECLEGFGEIAATSGRTDRAARLLGAAQAIRDVNGSTVQPVNRPIHTRTLALARQALGEAAFSEAWVAGRALSPEQAIEEALKVRRLVGAVEGAPPSGGSLLSAREWEVAP